MELFVLGLVALAVGLYAVRRQPQITTIPSAAAMQTWEALSSELKEAVTRSADSGKTLFAIRLLRDEASLDFASARDLVHHVQLRDTIGFDIAIEVLGISSLELKQRIARGEVKAHRRGKEMVFRRSELGAAKSSVSVGGKVGVGRCPYCHSDVEAETGVACTACLARHHSDCWDEHQECASCGGRSRYGNVETSDGRLRSAPDRHKDPA